MHAHTHTHTHTHTHEVNTLTLLITGELDANRPVPFRLTPALQSLISQISVVGPLQLSMVAAARCLVQPHFGLENILRAVLRDEFIAWRKVSK